MNKSLKDETLECLKDNKKTESEVLYVCNDDISFSFDQFCKLSEYIYYDSGYGGEAINLSLMVVGNDWWLERGEYDGSEWWEFKTMPKKPKHQFPKLLDIVTDETLIELKQKENI